MIPYLRTVSSNVMNHQRDNPPQAHQKANSEEPRIPSAIVPATAAIEGTFDLMSIAFPSDNAQEAEQQGERVSEELFRIFCGRLSPSDVALFESSIEDPTNGLKDVGLWDKFDEILIEQAVYLGWRMYLSHVVLTRIAVWADHDPRVSGLEKLEKFKKSVIRYGKVKRGLAQLPLSEPEWRETRKNMRVEIKTLQRKLAARFTMNRRMPNEEEAYAVIRTEIEKAPKEYQNLYANLTSFLDFLREKDSPFIMLTNDVTPGVILDGLLDYQACTAEGKSRQIISRLGNPRRRR